MYAKRQYERDVACACEVKMTGAWRDPTLHGDHVHRSTCDSMSLADSGLAYGSVGTWPSRRQQHKNPQRFCSKWSCNG